MSKSHPLDRLVSRMADSSLPVFIIVLALLSGVLALQFTAREEEPQIALPMIDVMISSPGLSALQVERQVTIPLEKLLAQIVGVEHVYSTSHSGHAVVTLRFYVGENRETALLNTYNKLYSNQDRVPGVVSDWLLKPIEVDDVPILLFALWSDKPELYDDFTLRRMAQEMSTLLQAIPNTSVIEVTGGRPRRVQIQLQAESLAARGTTATDIVDALKLSNVLKSAGDWTLGSETLQLESGDVLRDPSELKKLVVNVVNGVPVYLQDVAHILDGPAEPESYSWLELAPGHPAYGQFSKQYPMVSISVAKQRGSDAVAVANAVHERLAQLRSDWLPSEVHIEVLRDYGATADDKVNDLTVSLGIAVLTVVIFITVFMGWRPALVVGIAVPVCYGLTLGLDWYFGYTINRVTLFALILSLGLLVDDPITGVDNIDRNFTRLGFSNDSIVAAMAEIRIPLLMSTLTIVLAFLPLAYISGMMGPYMAPMAFNVPVSVIASTLVAFLITPWLALKLLRPRTEKTNAFAATTKPLSIAPSGGLYRRLLEPLLVNRRRAIIMLLGVITLFVLAASLPVLRLVPLKLLPFDNKNELQIVVDMPESSSLEITAAVVQRITTAAKRLPEVRAVASYVGEPSPIDFNGMVRRYYQRSGAHMADVRLTLADKTERRHQSHSVVLRLRELIRGLDVSGANIKVVEVPPGPPVISTLVAELYGDTDASYQQLQAAAIPLIGRLQREPHVVEVDSSIAQIQQRLRFVVDKPKAALSGVTTADINQTISMANQGLEAGFVYLADEAKPLPIVLRLPLAERSSVADLARIQVKGRSGFVQQRSVLGLDSAPQPLVALGELGEFHWQEVDQAIYHKDLKPVVYVMAELSGRTPAEVIADVVADQVTVVASKSMANQSSTNDWHQRTFLESGGGDSWQLPPNIQALWSGEGEWRITLRVFRDMGMGFVFALVAIFVLLRVQTGSSALAGIIMSAIPLTVVGIMPGFSLLNQLGERVVAGAPDPVLFTATAMIGMIALAGIVVRNSLILVEFIGQAIQRGMPLREALIEAGTIRMRPILLTAGTTLLGNLVIILDPVFSGLALAIIFGILSSTVFTLLVVPVVYLLVFERQVEEHPDIGSSET